MVARAYRTNPLFGLARRTQIWQISGIQNINRGTKVVASISEVGGPPGGPLNVPFLGDAAMHVFDVTPADDGNIYVRTFIDWDAQLSFQLTFFVDP